MPKIIALFPDSASAAALRQEAQKNGMKTTLATLSHNGLWEIERAAVILRKDRHPFYWGTLAGALIGLTMGFLMIRGRLAPPLLLPVMAGGPVVTLFLLSMFGAVLWGLVGALWGLLNPLAEIAAGQSMVSLFCMSGQKAYAADIIYKYGGRIV